MKRPVRRYSPTTAPGNFTWLPDAGHFVMTSFYPYQWDLNYRNPIVLNEMIFNMLYLANQGVDIVRLDAVPYMFNYLRYLIQRAVEYNSFINEKRTPSLILYSTISISTTPKISHVPCWLIWFISIQIIWHDFSKNKRRPLSSITSPPIG